MRRTTGSRRIVAACSDGPDGTDHQDAERSHGAGEGAEHVPETPDVTRMNKLDRLTTELRKLGIVFQVPVRTRE